MGTAGVVAAALVAAVLSKQLRKWRLQRMFRVARGAEKQALGLAVRAGYRVLDDQVRGMTTMTVDGETVEIELRADLLLKKGAKTYVAEVKSGRQAPDPTGRRTRRQLLEYACAFRVDGILLFDMAAEKIHRIGFPRVRGPRRLALGRTALFLLLLLGFGLAGQHYLGDTRNMRVSRKAKFR